MNDPGGWILGVICSTLPMKMAPKNAIIMKKEAEPPQQQTDKKKRKEIKLFTKDSKEN